jgi:hypothetical protein
MSRMRTKSRQAPIVSTVLVLTNEGDTTASMVIEALVNHGAVVTQVDTGDFPQRWTVTGRIDSAGVEECLDPEALGVTANQFQRYIGDKDADLGITAVGERLFPVAIRARTPAARVDWRRDYDSLDYEVVEVPDDVAAGLRAYLKAAGLAFAAFDLVRTTVGEHYLFEFTDHRSTCT